MEKISAKDLTKIIKACKISGVSELKIGSIEIKFSPGDAAKLAKTGETVQAPTPEELAVIEAQSSLQQNAYDAEDELAFMQVENPVLYEQLLVERDLETIATEGEIPDDVGNEKT